MVPILVDLRRQHLKGRWDNETLHVIGLVHDLGHVIAVSHFHREYEQASKRRVAPKTTPHLAGEVFSY